MVASLPVPEAVARARDRSEEIAVARAQLAQADAQVTQAAAAALPQVGTDFSYNRTIRSIFDALAVPPGADSSEIPLAYDETRTPNERYDTMSELLMQDFMNGLISGLPFGRRNTYVAMLQVNQPIFAGGRIKGARNIAQHLGTAAEARLEETEADLILAVRVAYLNALLAERLHVVALQSRQTAQDHVRQVEDFRESQEGDQHLRLVVRRASSLVDPLPESYLEKLKHVPGVRMVHILSWFGGIYGDERNFFANFGCDPETLFPMFNENRVPPEQLAAFKKERTAAVAGRKLAERFTWRLGDKITLQGTIFPVDLEFTLRGIYTGLDETAFFFHHTYLDEALGRPGKVGTFWLKAASAAEVPAVIERVDAMFKNSHPETKTETERAFQLGFLAMLGKVKTLISSISSVVIVDWALSDRVRLVNPLRAGPSGPAGLEHDYRFDGGWNLGLGAAWRTTRFRLSDSGRVANGIGEERGAPVFLRGTRHFGERATLNIYAGLVAAGQLRIADSSGKQLHQVDVGRAPLFGATFSARF